MVPLRSAIFLYPQTNPILIPLDWTRTSDLNSSWSFIRGWRQSPTQLRRYICVQTICHWWPHWTQTPLHSTQPHSNSARRKMYIIIQSNIMIMLLKRKARVLTFHYKFYLFMGKPQFSQSLVTTLWERFPGCHLNGTHHSSLNYRYLIWVLTPNLSGVICISPATVCLYRRGWELPMKTASTVN